MLNSIFSLLIGSTLLYFGAECIVKGGVSVAKRFGISTLVVGLTVVAFGTSLPELVVSIIAAIENSSTLAIGNVVGSNIANIGLALALSSLIFPITINYLPIKRDLWIYLFACLLFILFVFDGRLSRFEGLFLFIGLVFYIIICIHNPLNDEYEPQDHLDYSLVKAITYIIAGILSLAFGANLFVDGAVYLARYLGVSEIVIGMSIVALGTSLPELATSAMAAFRKESAISVGNIVGSNIFNILSVLGITSLITPLDSPKEILYFELPVMVLFGLAIIVIAKLPQPINRAYSTVLLLGYLLFIYLLF
ncbi:uncharacterized protein METZ01_LOCUS124247 [marine metagenome]|uniref:Sodium/calcium exchanger membrane region domain-containing protein n=1 Tax=marine metagenome TaxID=408172 RepID=A0A381Y4L2_9ZZZZ